MSRLACLLPWFGAFLCAGALVACTEDGDDVTSGSGGTAGDGGSGGSGAATSAGGNGGSGAGTTGTNPEGGAGGTSPEVVLSEAHCPGGAPTLAKGTVIVFGGGGTEGRTSFTQDGASWSDVTTVSNGPQFEGHSRNLIRGVGYGGGVFVAVGGLDNAYVVTTCDGEHYRQDVLGTNIEGDIPAPYADFMSDVAYKDGVFVAAGGGGKKIVSKDHGLTWQAVGGGEPGHLRGIAAGNGLFVVAGHLWNSDDAMIATSPDGETWSETATSPGGLGRGVVFGNGLFVAIGATRCVRSKDGVAWTDCGISGGADQMGLHFVNGQFLVQRADGTASMSADAETWTSEDGWLPDRIVWNEKRYIMSRWGARGWSEGSLFQWNQTQFPVDQGLGDLASGPITYSP
ncbi:MAG: hypothetical protein R3B70_43825 [Polyangiaceae bacterium]